MNDKLKMFLVQGAKRLGPFLIRHRFSVLLAVVVIYFFPWSKTLKRLTDRNSESSHESDSGAARYEPTAIDTDPKLSLPAELKSEELQAFARKVRKLEDDANLFLKLDDEHGRLLGILLEEKVKNLLLPAIQGNGFKDQKLPLDWYAAVKDDYAVKDMPAQLAEVEVTTAMMMALSVRLPRMKVGLIGGKITVGDTLFVKSIQIPIDSRLANLSKTVPLMEDVMHRLAKEFPDQMKGDLAGLAAKYPNKFVSPFPPAWDGRAPNY